MLWINSKHQTAPDLCVHSRWPHAVIGWQPSTPFSSWCSAYCSQRFLFCFVYSISSPGVGPNVCLTSCVGKFQPRPLSANRKAWQRGPGVAGARSVITALWCPRWCHRHATREMTIVNCLYVFYGHWCFTNMKIRNKEDRTNKDKKWRARQSGCPNALLACTFFRAFPAV